MERKGATVERRLDLGWQVIAVPEPSGLLLCGLGAGVIAVRRRRAA